MIALLALGCSHERQLGPLELVAAAWLPEAAVERCIDDWDPVSRQDLVLCRGAKADTQVVVSAAKRGRRVVRVLVTWKASSLADAGLNAVARIGGTDTAGVPCIDPDLFFGWQRTHGAVRTTVLGISADSTIKVVFAEGGRSPYHCEQPRLSPLRQQGL